MMIRKRFMVVAVVAVVAMIAATVVQGTMLMKEVTNARDIKVLNDRFVSLAIMCADRVLPEQDAPKLTPVRLEEDDHAVLGLTGKTVGVLVEIVGELTTRIQRLEAKASTSSRGLPAGPTSAVW